tara:strand:- start:362 stop:841 length:480 start_codon:yes stop_codon:yes gene_type:complete
MVKQNWAENIILGIIALNIFVLAYVFLIPRAQFIIDHWEWDSEALMEIQGAMDIPNQYSKTYKVANHIRNSTNKDSVILMPADNWEFGSNRSVVIQRLYPREVYFMGDESFYNQKNNADFEKMVYAIAFPDDGANLCFEKKYEKLGETGFVICRSSIPN